ncbi:hypothetical protein A0J61_07365 [Choanephora cucurbitarum]|uniref:Uncharacterized protein n=1 Tax=Choanephora cucurbitarum TaxID=101091 RepID=A0A1C7N631_9FUNG|nr:hypothetical protein A0J61_07365 [Choanephora cucurbitarum]
MGCPVVLKYRSIICLVPGITTSQIRTAVKVKVTASEMRGILSDEAIMSTPALQNLRAKCRHDEQTLDTVNFFKLKDALVLNEEKAQHVREKKKKIRV